MINFLIGFITGVGVCILTVMIMTIQEFWNE